MPSGHPPISPPVPSHRNFSFWKRWALFFSPCNWDDISERLLIHFQRTIQPGSHQRQLPKLDQFSEFVSPHARIPLQSTIMNKLCGHAFISKKLLASNYIPHFIYTETAAVTLLPHSSRKSWNGIDGGKRNKSPSEIVSKKKNSSHYYLFPVADVLNRNIWHHKSGYS